MRGAGGPVILNIQSFSEKSKHPFTRLNENRPSFRVNTGRLRQARALQKPLRLGHSHASMAAALALHGFAGAAPEPRSRGSVRPGPLAGSGTLTEPGASPPLCISFPKTEKNHNFIQLS